MMKFSNKSKQKYTTQFLDMKPNRTLHFWAFHFLDLT